VSHVVCLLGPTDRLPWPDLGQRAVLRLEFDDTYLNANGWIAPSDGHIQKLIDFAQVWDGQTTMLLSCRAASARSPSAGLIALAAIGRLDLVLPLLQARSYHRPNTKMLELADSLMSPSPRLLETVRKTPPSDRTDAVTPVEISLR
jgi:predicted protein tyrosine phosphatase